MIKKKKGNLMKKIMIIVLASLLALGAAAFFAVPYFVKSANYSKAEALLEEKDYRGALAQFQKIGDFRDSSEKIQELETHKIPYAEAEALLSGGEFEKAIEAFEQLKYYDDSPKKALEAKYGLGGKYFDEGEYEKAIEIFGELDDYRDSPAKALEAKYAIGDRYFSEGAYEKAIGAFGELGSYADSADRVLEAKYAVGDRYFFEGTYEKALEIFAEISGYGDSSLRVLEVTYAIAEKYFQNADYATAETIFGELTKQNYGDSDARLRETKRHMTYNEAAADLKKRDFMAAYDKFKSLGDFLDCAEKLVETDDAYWQQTVSRGTMDAYDAYMKFDGAKHKAEAETERERLYGIEQKSKATNAYNAAVNSKKISELKAFISQWKDSPYVGDLIGRAEKWVASILADSNLSAPILNNPNNATQKMIDDFLDDYPGHKDEAKVLALGEGDLLALVQAGTISASVAGDAIDFTTVRLTNNSKRDISVTIPIGAYFAASNASVQNMAVRAPKTVTLWAGESTSVSVATACMNINREIPNSNNGFSIYGLNNPRLVRVMEKLKESNASYAVTQAAVWIVTDNPSEYALLNTLVYTDGRRAISADDLAKAKEIVRAAG